MTGRGSDDRAAIHGICVVLLAVVSTTLAACAVPGPAGAGAPGSGGPAGTGAARATAMAPGPAGSAALDAPVIRHGVRPRLSVPATQGSFLASGPVRYPDGVSVTVTAIRHAVQGGSGPGTFTGRAYSALTFLVRNGSAHTVDLGAVAVRASSGATGRAAEPVYPDHTDGSGSSEQAALDFSGTVRPGGTATATYLFAIPPAELGTVTAAIDVDGVHAAAVFRGGLR